MKEKEILTSFLSRRDFLRLSAATAAAGILASCAPKEDAPGPAETGEEPAPAEPVELTWMYADRELSKKENRWAIDLFNQEMEEAGKPWRLKEELGPATDNDLQAKLVVDGAAGTLSDVVDLSNKWVADMVSAGYLLDITDRLNVWDGWDHYFDIIKELASFGGKWYTVPGGVDVMNIFYRKDVLEGAGISYDQPNTYDDFFALCEEIAAKTDAWPCGFPAGLQWGGGSWEEGFKHVLLGFVDEQNEICDLNDGKWIVKSDALLNAFKVYETLATNGWLTVDMLLSPNPWEPIKYQGFPEGSVVTVTGGTWQWSFDWGPDGATPIEGLFEKVETWLWPHYSGEPYVYAGLSGSMGIATNSEYPDGTWEAVTFLNRPDVICGKIEYADYPDTVARDDVMSQCEYLRTAIEGKMAEATDSLSAGRSVRPMPGESKIADVVASVTEELITGNITADEALEKFAEDAMETLGSDFAKEA